MVSDGGHFSWRSETPKLTLATYPDCTPYETFTPWAATTDEKPQNVPHTHRWVYAEKSEVNEYVYPYHALALGCMTPCGPCAESENEARICSVCLRNETRVRSWGWTEKPKQESEYLKLKNRKPLTVTAGPGAGEGCKIMSAQGSIGDFIVSFSTGKKPKSNGVIFSIESTDSAMLISGSNGIEGDTFRKDATKFYVVKTSDGFELKSIGALSEYFVYSIKITFQ